MKGFILAAGLGTRLKPWTDSNPKALVPVKGVPALERLVDKMHGEGIHDITVNVHHFADKIVDFIHSRGWNINISDERGQLLDTGGALLKAAPFLEGDEPVLVHNVDIISNVAFSDVSVDGADVSLLVSDRQSSRKLIFDKGMTLRGWHNLSSGEFRPADTAEMDINGYGNISEDFRELAFSGIYVVTPGFIACMRKSGKWSGKFSIIDYLLATMSESKYLGRNAPGLKLIDIGKPDSLNRANASLWV